MDGADAAAAGQQQVPAIADSNANLNPAGGANPSPAGKKARVRKGKGRIEAGGVADADGSKRRCVSTACIGEEDIEPPCGLLYRSEY
jgi:hypothetical protein